jgi:hypothetical protein
MNERKANDFIRKLSDAAKSLIQSRTLLESTLFPVRTYMALGLYNLYEREYEVIREITKRKNAEEIGKSQKTLNAEINQKTQFSIIVGYLVGREQIRIDGYLEEYGGEKEDTIRLTFLLEFWEKFTKAYRNDGKLLVSESDGALRILESATVEELNTQLVPVNQQEKDRIKRMIALLQSYLYLANYESRGGVFNHGPYHISKDETLVVREFIHLDKHTCDENLRTQAPYPNIAVVMKLKNTKVSFNEVGTIFTEPVNYINHVTAINLFTTQGNIECVGVKEANILSEFAEKATKELFSKIAGWSHEKKVIAGALQYSDLSSYAKLGGIKYEHSLTERCLNRYLPKMLRIKVHPFVDRFFSTDHIFSQIR